MKKLLIMAAVAGFALTSCTNDEADLSMKNEQRVPISFAAPVNHNMSRPGGTVLYTADGHKAVVGEINHATYNTAENFTVYGKRYLKNTGYQGWGDVSSEDVFGVVSNAEGEGDSPSTEVAYVPGDAANGWFPKYPYFFFEDYKYAFGAVSPCVDDTEFKKNINDGSAGLTYDKFGLNITKYKSDNTKPTTQTEKKTFTNHYDLMFSNRIYAADRTTPVKKNVNSNGEYNGINLVFNHALSSVHFKVCIDPDFVKTYNDVYGVNGSILGNGKGGADVSENMFKLKTIKIKNVYGEGDFCQQISDNAVNGADGNIKGTPLWTLGSYSADKEYVFFDCAEVNSNTTGFGINVPAASFTKITDAATDIVNVPATDPEYGNATQVTRILNRGAESEYPIGRYGLMIPQTFGSSAEIEIVYTFTYKSGNGAEQTKEFTKHIKLEDISSTEGWVYGKKYTYVIAFRGDLIYFAPQVTDWETGTIDYDADENHNNEKDHIVL